MNLKYLSLALLPILFASCRTESKSRQSTKRPNIVFIMSDDHAYQAISAYDDKLIQTPNIDRIAKEGMLFNNATVTNSICAPSRAVILTGKHSHLNGKIDNRMPFDTTNVTFPQLLQKAGYQTAMFGKLHFGNSPKGLMSSRFYRDKEIIIILNSLPKRGGYDHNGLRDRYNYRLDNRLDGKKEGSRETLFVDVPSQGTAPYLDACRTALSRIHQKHLPPPT